MSERIHPYDLVFANELEAEVFPQIREEAEERAVDVRDTERFLMLEHVGQLLRALRPPEAQGAAVSQFGAIVTHAYHFWLAGKPTFAIDEPVLRSLLGGATLIGSWDMVPPAPAGYVQLPRNMLFARIAEGAQAEAIDGFFFIMPGVNDSAVPPYERLAVLLVLGVLPQRAGFSVIQVSTTVTADAPGHLGDVTARADGNDFENVLPGGAGRLFAVTNELEVLKLVSRCLWHLRASG
jgi:hypothetical protein